MEMNYKESYEMLLRRFKHLMQSDFIASFDEYNNVTKLYRRDIKEADKIANVKKHRNSIEINVEVVGVDEILEKTKQIVLNLEKAVELKRKLQ